MNGLQLFNAIANIDERILDKSCENIQTKRTLFSADPRKLTAIAASALALFSVLAFVCGYGQPKVRKGLIGEWNATQTEEIMICDTYNYKIVKKGEKYYILMKYEEMKVDTTAGLYFSSIDELKSILLSGNFSQEQLQTVQSFEKDENGIKLFDLDNPPKPFEAENAEISGIFWQGEKITYFLKDNK